MGYTADRGIVSRFVNVPRWVYSNTAWVYAYVGDREQYPNCEIYSETETDAYIQKIDMYNRVAR